MIHALCTKTTLLAVLLVLGLTVLSGCSGHAARTQDLLAVNYEALNDEELLLYYYELEDQIATVELSQTSPRISFGLGLGNYSGRTATSGGVGISTGGRPEIATGLRDQRKRVRLELQRRELSPQPW
ncbi:MAG: hypothetical protein R6W66_09090 [Pelovirga sp.]